MVILFPGLKLELYLEQNEYIPGLTVAAGIRVVIHDQSYYPFPEDKGFSVSPGKLTFIGLEKVWLFMILYRILVIKEQFPYHAYHNTGHTAFKIL